ncbi:MAG: hypothetical protein HY021_01190 [Burkholderiales bacterium]|nr:hypothetical protein [Burkholderiales bacterium]
MSSAAPVSPFDIGLSLFAWHERAGTLAVFGPVLGHASWHAYRAAVDVPAR